MDSKLWAVGGDNDMKLIGLSLSFCIKDILNGKVNLDNVAGIFTSTMIKSDDDLIMVIDLYCDTYWANPLEDDIDTFARATEVVRELMSSGRIFQPRVMGLEAVNFANYGGHWVSRDSVNKYGITIGGSH